MICVVYGSMVFKSLWKLTNTHSYNPCLYVILVELFTSELVPSGVPFQVYI